ncbi:MAG: hypothetical protein HKO01_12040 [Flaviramulus sp.]|nr:hypothetical protein [Flaviramulus sp.]NNC51252.1 hypothetical protein [Flaviramulus sp.]
MEEKIRAKKTKKRWLKVLQFFAAYLVAAWTFLQFIDWALNRYNISPHWVDILLWIFIGITPSLMIYLYNQERINNRVLRLREKIIFPTNIILIMVVTYFGFGNNDLGATTKSINYTTEQGEKVSTLITKEEFRTSFPIFNFKPKTKDSTKLWLEFGISMLLHEDLLQNKNLNPKLKGIRNTVDKVKQAKYFNNHYIDGEFKIIDSTYIITTFIRNSKDAKVITQKTHQGKDVLNLIDEITVFITDHFTRKEFNAPKYIDLDVKDFTSNSLKAIEHYRNGDYELAIKEDSTFALAYLNAAKRNLTYNQGKFEERYFADNAYKYRSKLPLQGRGETLIWKYLAYDQFEKAEKLIKLQLQVDPKDQAYKRMLYGLYGRTKNIKAYTEQAYSTYKSHPSIDNGYSMINAALIKEDYDNILNEIKKVELISLDEDLSVLKLQPQLFKGDLEAAEKTLNQIELLHPEAENLTKVFKKALNYLRKHKVTIKDLKKFEGEYRSNANEQTITFWIENNILLRYVSNQVITPYLVAGENTIVSGTPNLSRTWKNTFYKNNSNNYYSYKEEQNDFRNSHSRYHWKIDSTIKKAENLLDAQKLDSAKKAYEIAIKLNPKHYFLKDILAHINYVKNTDSLTLQNQFKEVVGTYGPRKFWSENGKLFYKRETNVETGQVFAKIELLPISKNRYINRSKLNFSFAFEYENDKAIGSYSYEYILEEESWNKSESERNTFKKDH